jgi:hypothetical protein
MEGERIDVLIATKPGNNVVGRVSIAGENSAAQPLTVTLHPADPDQSPRDGGALPHARVDAEGRFSIRNAWGPMFVRVDPLSGLALSHVWLSATDVTDRSIDVAAADVTQQGLSIELTNDPPTVSGRVHDNHNRVIDRCTVVVAPTFLGDVAPLSRRVASSPCLPDGSFSDVVLPPGRYFAFAVSEIVDGQIFDMEWLQQHYADANPSFLLTEHDHLLVDVRFSPSR